MTVSMEKWTRITEILILHDQHTTSPAQAESIEAIHNGAPVFILALLMVS